MALKVGLIVGMEWSFPPAFIEEVNRRDEGVVAEFVSLDAVRMDEPVEYAVIIDRISHEVPFYRTYLKFAALQGCHVVNNPFMWTADDKFFGAALATRLGIAHPRTVVLPNREYIPGIDHAKSLRNLKFPIDWQGIVDYVGLPCVLKDAHGGGWRDVYVCRSMDELIHHYNNSGQLTMVVQEFIHWDHFVRCICLGQETVLPIKYDPRERRYHVEHEHLSPELGRRVVEDSLKLVRALGYDMNSMEWAIKDGVPYAIDFMNPAPDMDVNSLTPHYFDWVVKHMADMAIRLARTPRPQGRELRWDGLFTGTRHEVRGEASGGQAGSQGGGRRLTGHSDLDGAGDLAEELPSLAQGLGSIVRTPGRASEAREGERERERAEPAERFAAGSDPARDETVGDEPTRDDTAGDHGLDRAGTGAKPTVPVPPALSPDAPGVPSVADPAHQTDPSSAE